MGKRRHSMKAAHIKKAKKKGGRKRHKKSVVKA